MTVRDLPHIAGRIFNTPLLIQGGKLETILSAVGPRLLSGDLSGITAVPRVRAEIEGRRRLSGGGYLVEGGIAVLPVVGTLVHRGSWLDAACGMASYQALAESVCGILESPDVRGLMLEMDSPGGEVAGCFDLARYIRADAAEYGKPVWAVANELAASAGYAIASAASRIYVPQTGIVGSVGIVGVHIDQTAADSMAGLKWTMIYAGEHKVDLNSHAPLTDGALARAQADVDRVYGMFIDLVAEHRGMKAAAVRETKADVFRGALAVEVGLADDVGTLDEAIEAFAEFLDQPAGARSSATMQGINTMRKPIRAEGEQPTETEIETPAVTPDPVVEPAAPVAPAPVATVPAVGLDAVAAERKRSADLATLATQASRLGVSFDLAAAIGGNVTVEAARESILNSAAERDAATPTIGASFVGDQRVDAERGAVAAGWDAAIENVKRRRGFAA